MDKLIKDGKVAVIYSPGYGAGWYTWNEKHKACLFDPEIAELVLRKEKFLEDNDVDHRDLGHHQYYRNVRPEEVPSIYKQFLTPEFAAIYRHYNDLIGEIELLAEQKWPGGYWTAEDLEVEWMDQDQEFYVKEYDGSESIKYGYSDFIRA